MRDFEAAFGAAAGKSGTEPPFEEEARTRDEFWTKLKRVAGRIPFLDDLLTVYYCAMDPATPARVRAMLFAALAYFIMPADTVPDAIVAFGFTDDAAVIAAVIGLVGTYVKPRHRAAAARALGKDVSGEARNT